MAQHRHSKFGFASLVIGLFNLLIIAYLVWLFVSWSMAHPEIVSDPTKVGGMPVPDVIVINIIILVTMEITGLLVGVLGLFSKDKRKTLPVIGIILNGLCLLLTAPKVSWNAWREMVIAFVKLFDG